MKTPLPCLLPNHAARYYITSSLLGIIVIPFLDLGMLFWGKKYSIFSIFVQFSA